MSSTAAAIRMNLAALQRVDSTVTEIIDNASQVALYKFGAATNGWEKTEIEGALFVFAWSKNPRHGFIVMNRLSTTNLLQEITQDVEFQAQSPFLLYKSNGGIFCVWFYDAKECDRIGRLFQSLTMSSKPKYRQRCASESDSRLRGLHNGATRDIVTLLAKAKDEYNMKKGETSSSQKRRERGRASGPSVAPAPAAEPVLHKPTPVRGGTNGAPSTPLSVATLFAAAAAPRADARESLMRALLANPDNRLEHVERAQQHGTPHVAVAPPDVEEVSTRLRAASCQADLSSWEEEEVAVPVLTPAMLGPLAAPPATSDLPLLTPEAFTRPAPAYTSGVKVANGDPPVPALTKDQLRDALIHMLQTDEGFLLKLHEAYVGSLRCRLHLEHTADHL